MVRRSGWNLHGSRQLSTSTRHLNGLWHPEDNLGLRGPRSRRLLSHGAAPGVKHWAYYENVSKDVSPEERRPLQGGDRKEIWTNHRKELNGRPPDQREHTLSTDTTKTTTSSQSTHNTTTTTATTTTPPAPIDESVALNSDTKPPPTQTDRTRSRERTDPAADKYNATSELYDAALGTKLNWTKALESVTKNESDQSMSPRERRALIHRKATKSLYKRKAGDRSAVEIPSVRALATALWQEDKSTQYLFRLYRELPVPGVSFLSKRTRGELLRRFSKPPNRRWVDTRRYLSLVEDMIASKLPLSLSLWTSAIHLASRASGRVWKRDLIRAIGLWQQMEHGAGVQSDGVVFTILFDVSIKAGQYTVADRLLQEMTKRGHSFERSGKVSMIYYQGLQQNVDGIRQAYNDFVDKGGLVDTVVLNCLMVSFINAGDIETAGHLYQRMLQAHTAAQKRKGATKTTHHLPTLSSEFNIYHKRAQKLGQLLNASASLKESFPNHHAALQEALPMAPDTRTFYIFLKYHAHQSGNLHGFMSVLADMESIFVVPPRGLVYLLLFEGFSKHGRKRKGWTAARLKEAWKAYLRALYESKHRLDERFLPQTRKIVWENPLASTAAAHMAKSSPPSEDASSELYTPLPLSKPEQPEVPSEYHYQASQTVERETANEEDSEVEEFDGNADNYMEMNEDVEMDVDVDKLFGTAIRTRHEPMEDELEEMERRIENGVFLGRRMIVTILRAFGACCKPEDVMDVWLTIERIWQPKKRKALDVIIVKDEVEKQMERMRRTY